MNGPHASVLTCSVVIPTYGRDGVLLDTVRHMLAQQPAPLEVLVVDQTPKHGEACEQQLAQWAREGRVRWERRTTPSIPQAMNHGLRVARGDIVLFLDDDIQPEPGLVGQHLAAQAAGKARLVAGRVVQPWDPPQSDHAATGPFLTLREGERTEFMGGNFSLDRRGALALGGFDENFVRVAYRFEAEFAHRWRAAGERIWYAPQASLRHLKVAAGGTRTYGDHLRTARPGHAVGEYYYLLRARPAGWLGRALARPWRSIRTRHHLTRPWWIPLTLVAELSGSLWALALWLRGPRLLAGASAPVAPSASCGATVA